MKRFLRAAALAALAILPLAHPASANLRLITKQIKWTNTNRWGCANPFTCTVGNDTVYASMSSTKNDTSVVFSTGDLVPLSQAAYVATDSVRVFFARIFVVSDSAAAGDWSQTTLTLQGVGADTTGTLSTSTPGFSLSTGVTLFTKAFGPTSGARVVSFPIISPGTSVLAPAGRGFVQDAAGTSWPMGWPAWRLVLASNIGTIARVRLFISYYIDA